MKTWQDFLDTFSTKGGNVFLLFIIFGGVMALVLHVLHHGDTGEVKTVILSTFSGFSGALLVALRGGESRQQQNGGPGPAPTPSVPVNPFAPPAGAPK